MIEDDFDDFDGGADAGDAIFDEAFSQLLNEPAPANSTAPPVSKNKRTAESKKRRASSASLPDTLDAFEEAFTAIKSIQAAHEPFSATAINAYLFYRRGIDTTKRNVPGLTWPEHPQTFSHSRLISAASGQIDYSLDKEEAEFVGIPPHYISSDESEDSDSEDEESKPVPLCEISQNPKLHAALVRTCQSIYRQRSAEFKQTASSGESLIEEIDPHLSHVIARRCSFLLQQIFSRALLTRRSALKLIQQIDSASQKQQQQVKNSDVENVPVNWEDTREATRQLVGQAALDYEVFSKFSARLHKTFKK